MPGLERHDQTTRTGKHTHHYTYSDEPLPGVTTVIGATLPKPALVPWAAKTVATYAVDNQGGTWSYQDRDTAIKHLKSRPYAERDQAANRGTEVHAIGEKLVKGEQVDVPVELTNYVDNYLRFLDDWQPRPVLVEATVGTPHMYAGQLDLVADLPDGTRALMDLKTSKGVYPEVCAQCAAYRYAAVYLDDDGNEQPMADLGINASYVVHVTANGYDVRPIETGIDTAYAMFINLLEQYRMQQLMKNWLGEPTQPDWEH